MVGSKKQILCTGRQILLRYSYLPTAGEYFLAPGLETCAGTALCSLSLAHPSPGGGVAFIVTSVDARLVSSSTPSSEWGLFRAHIRTVLSPPHEISWIWRSNWFCFG